MAQSINRLGLGLAAALDSTGEGLHAGGLTARSSGLLASVPGVILCSSSGRTALVLALVWGGAVLVEGVSLGCDKDMIATHTGNCGLAVVVVLFCGVALCVNSFSVGLAALAGEGLNALLGASGCLGDLGGIAMDMEVVSHTVDGDGGVTGRLGGKGQDVGADSGLNSLVQEPVSAAVGHFMPTASLVAARSAMIAQILSAQLDQPVAVLGAILVGILPVDLQSGRSIGHRCAALAEGHILAVLILQVELAILGRIDAPDGAVGGIVQITIQVQECILAGMDRIQQSLVLAEVVEDVLAAADNGIILAQLIALGEGQQRNINNLIQVPLAAGVIRTIPSGSCVTGAGSSAEAVVVVQAIIAVTDLPSTLGDGACNDLNLCILGQVDITVGRNIQIISAIGDGVSTINLGDGPAGVVAKRSNHLQTHITAVGAGGNMIAGHKVVGIGAAVAVSAASGSDDCIGCATLDFSSGSCSSTLGGIGDELNTNGNNAITKGAIQCNTLQFNTVGIANIHVDLGVDPSDVVLLLCIATTIDRARMHNKPVAGSVDCCNQVLAFHHIVQISDHLIAGDDAVSCSGSRLEEVHIVVSISSVGIIITTLVPPGTSLFIVEMQAALGTADVHGAGGRSSIQLEVSLCCGLRNHRIAGCTGVHIDLFSISSRIGNLPILARTGKGVLAICQGNHTVIVQNDCFTDNRSFCMSMAHREHTQDHDKCQQEA